MWENVQLKVYGHIWPVQPALLQALASLSGAVMGRNNDDIPLFEQEGDLVRISFEGVWFPVDATLDVIRAQLTPTMRGKLDVLDLDAWMLTRHTFADGIVQTSTAPLNHVLDYSGH